MDVVRAALLAALTLCAVAAASTVPAARAQSPAVWVSQTTDLLGRQVTVAPATVPDHPWGDPQRLAFCGPDGIQRSLDGGQTWSRVPTDGVAALAAGTAMPLAPRLGQTPACQSVVLDPSAPDTFYAVFEAVKAPQDAPPPWFAAGYVTVDAGQSWQAVPVPPVRSPSTASGALQFRGFSAAVDGVQALFAPPPTGPDGEMAAPMVLATADGGQTWQPAPFGCPASGPCLRWGAPPTAIGSCNMHGYGQPLLVSADGGQTWTSPAGARVANACFPNELVATSDQDVLLLAPAADELEAISAPVRISHDGGRMFSPVTLPADPDATDLFELHLLSNGRVLARVSGSTPGPGWTWQVLTPDLDQADGASATGQWCVVQGAALPTSGAPLRVAGDRVWWLAGAGQPASLTAADLSCAVPGFPAPRQGP